MSSEKNRVCAGPKLSPTLIFRVECLKTKKTLFTELKKLLKEKLKKALTDARSKPNMLRLQFDSL